MSVLVLCEHDVHAHLPMRDCIEDLAAAELAVGCARAAGAGTEVAF